jgi:hypothetical protein
MTEVTAVSVVPDAHAGDSLEPRSLKQLAWFCNEMSKSGLFTVAMGQQQRRNITPQEAFVVIQEGLGLGLTPVQALRDIYVVVNKGVTSTVVSYRAIAARITADPRVEFFDWEGDETRCRIVAQRRGRNRVEIEVRADQYTAADRERHKDHLEDFLFARAIRRLAKRGFSDLVLGVRLPDEPEEVIDVGAVERDAGVTEYGAHEGCGGGWRLRTTPHGGAYLRCDKCGDTQPPPAPIRDTLRGRSDQYRLDGPTAAQDALEPGERPITQAHPESQAVASQAAAEAVESSPAPAPAAEAQPAAEPGPPFDIPTPEPADPSPAGSPTAVDEAPADEPVDAAANAGALLEEDDGRGFIARPPAEPPDFAKKNRERVAKQILDRGAEVQRDGTMEEKQLLLTALLAVKGEHAWDQRSVVPEWLTSLTLDELEAVAAKLPRRR